MGRLIDADAFKKDLKFMFVAEQMTGRLCEMLCKMVDGQPTAYDVDGVVEQLEQQVRQYKRRSKEYSEKRYFEKDANIQKSKAFSYECAIEIVKAGGVQNE